MNVACHLFGWLMFIFGMMAGMILLAIILHYVDKAMSK